jgi:hypothetical protein
VDLTRDSVYFPGQLSIHQSSLNLFITRSHSKLATYSSEVTTKNDFNVRRACARSRPIGASTATRIKSKFRCRGQTLSINPHVPRSSGNSRRRTRRESFRYDGGWGPSGAIVLAFLQSIDSGRAKGHPQCCKPRIPVLDASVLTALLKLTTLLAPRRAKMSFPTEASSLPNYSPCARHTSTRCGQTS